MLPLERLALLHHIPEVLDLDPGPGTGILTIHFSGFSQSFEANAKTIPQVSHLTFHFTFFPVSCLLIIPFFDTVYTELLNIR
jgi:hypothetical protein